jgi:hypothetical protein
LIQAAIVTLDANPITDILAQVHVCSLALFELAMEDEITIFTGIKWIVLIKAKSHPSIAPWTFNFIGYNFSRIGVLQFNRSHDAKLWASSYNRASTVGGVGACCSDPA